MSPLLGAAVALTVGAPLLLLLILGVAGVARPLGERAIGLVTRTLLLAALTGSLASFIAFQASGAAPQLVRYGDWFGAGAAVFAVDLAIDAMSLGFTVLSLLVCNVVASFSFRYLHREPGFQRYFVQMAMFVVGLTSVGLAGSVEVLFVGWELLGLSSALLVGFFQGRRAPVQNALRVFAVYRLSDAAMLSAAVLLHHWQGSGNLIGLFAAEPSSRIVVDSGQALALGLLLIVAVAGKSALWPLSGWLPRAMEGPTPSSAVYYGALSIHAGCFLLLRVQPLISMSMIATGLLILGGVITAMYGSLVGRVQTDVKSAISYATLTQVGIIVVEIALGLHGLALIHIAGHACFRLLQFLSAPNVLHDLHALESRLGDDLRTGRQTGSPRGKRTIYLFALERGFADSLLERVVVVPFKYVVSKLDMFDRLLVAAPRGKQIGSKE